MTTIFFEIYYKVLPGWGTSRQDTLWRYLKIRVQVVHNGLSGVSEMYWIPLGFFTLLESQKKHFLSE